MIYLLLFLIIGGDHEVSHAIARCPRPGAARIADSDKIALLFAIERELGAPAEARGILAATWCWEGAFHDAPLRGDIRADGSYLSHGPFQMQAWLRSWCRLPKGGADDLASAARCYLARVKSQVPHAAKRCGAEAAWMVAEAVTANVRVSRWRCDYASRHWRNK